MRRLFLSLALITCPLQNFVALAACEMQPTQPHEDLVLHADFDTDRGVADAKPFQTQKLFDRSPVGHYARHLAEAPWTALFLDESIDRAGLDSAGPLHRQCVRWQI